jgi:hypothetical protein
MALLASDVNLAVLKYQLQFFFLSTLTLNPDPSGWHAW